MASRELIGPFLCDSPSCRNVATHTVRDLFRRNVGRFCEFHSALKVASLDAYELRANHESREGSSSSSTPPTSSSGDAG